MIQSICIEYRRNSDSEWKLYKYVPVEINEGGGYEIGLLRKAFGQFFEFRGVIYTHEDVTIRQYDRTKREWVDTK